MYSREIVEDYNLTLKYVGYHILRKPKTQFWKRVVVGKSREREKKLTAEAFQIFPVGLQKATKCTLVGSSICGTQTNT